MKINAGRIALDKAVNLVSNALPSKDYGDATSGIMMEVPDDDLNVMNLTVNSLEVFIKTQIKLQEEGVAGVIVPNGNILYKVVSNLKNLKNPIEMNYDEENDVVNLSCGKDYEGSVAHYDSIGFTVPKSLSEIEELPTITLPVRLIKKSIDEVAFSCSKDKTHPELTGIFFDQNKNGMNIVATDSLRLSCIQFKSKINNPKSIILSVNHLQLLKKILGVLEIDDAENIKVHLSDDMAYFVHDGGKTIVGFQTLGDSYYEEYPSLLFNKNDCEISMTVNREHFLEKLDLAVSHNSSVQDVINLDLVSKKSGALKSKVDSSVGNVNTFDIPFTINKVETTAEKLKKFSVGVNPAFLYDVLGKVKEKEISISLVSRESGPVVVYPVAENSNGEYLHVFSLAD